MLNEQQSSGCVAAQDFTLGGPFRIYEGGDDIGVESAANHSFDVST